MGKVQPSAELATQGTQYQDLELLLESSPDGRTAFCIKQEGVVSHRDKPAKVKPLLESILII